ncbi:MAG: sugar ABC transporter permease [Desulfobacterales bacterium]|nr:MAG: sugar ABC transporter permease [Desulfobacterales bacterium]
MKYSRGNLLSRVTNSGYLFLAPAMIILVGLILYPFLYAINLSLQEWDMFSSAERHYIWFRNYANLFGNPTFWRSLYITIIFSFLSVSISFSIGFPLASILSASSRIINVLRTVFLMPMVLTPVVIGMAFKFLMDPSTGLINYLLSLVGIEGITWISDPKTALISLVIVDVWQWTPFIFLVMLAGFQGLPKAPYEAAQVDGLSKWQIARYISLPLLKPMMVLALLFRAIDSLKTFDIIFIMTNGGPGDVTTTLNISAFIKSFRLLTMGEGAAVVIIIWAIVLIFSDLFVRFTKAREEL